MKVELDFRTNKSPGMTVTQTEQFNVTKSWNTVDATW